MAVSKVNCPLIIYNNVALGEIQKFNPESTPVYDDQGNMLYVEHKITIESLLFGVKDANDCLLGGVFESAFPDYGTADSTDQIMHIVRKRLSEPRASLYVLNTGWGNTFIEGERDDFSAISEGEIESFIGDKFLTDFEVPITTPTVHRDVNFGPMPELISFETLGQKRTARLVWSIKFYTHECILWDSSSGVDALGRLLAFKYAIEYDIDDMYQSTRTVRGSATISNNTIAGEDGTRNYWKLIDKNVDYIRDTALLLFPIPNEFKRTKQRFVTNEKRQELTFEIVDTEIDSQEAYPSGAIEIEVDQDARSKYPFVNWVTSMSGTITLAPGVPYVRGYAILANIVAARFLKGVGTQYNVEIEAVEVTSGQYIAKETPREVVPIPISTEIRESVFKGRKRISFDFSWRNVVNEPSDVVTLTGLFTSISADPDLAVLEGTNLTWEYWKTDPLYGIGPLEANPRGYMDLYDEVNGQTGNVRIMMDPCDPVRTNPDVAATKQNNEFIPRFRNKVIPIPGGAIIPTLFDPPEPDFFNSIIENEWQIIKDSVKDVLQYNRTEQQTPDQSSDNYNGPNQDPKFSSEGASEMTDQNIGSGTRTIDQGPPSMTMWFIGEATRIGGPTPAPNITQLGGADVELVQEKTIHKPIQNAAGRPVYKSSFAQQYVVKGLPSGSALTEEGVVHQIVKR